MSKGYPSRTTCLLLNCISREITSLINIGTKDLKAFSPTLHKQATASCLPWKGTRGLFMQDYTTNKEINNVYILTVVTPFLPCFSHRFPGCRVRLYLYKDWGSLV